MTPNHRSLILLALGPLFMVACTVNDFGGNRGSGGANGPAGSNGSGTGGSSTSNTGGRSGSGGPKDAGVDITSGGIHPGTGGASGSGGAAGTSCDTTPGLVWKTANKTNFQSYPADGSEECIKYNGCNYKGQFSNCNDTKTESWVMSHNIVSVFPDTGLLLHDLCLKAGTKVIRVAVLDTCADSDCNGCCTQNKGSQPLLIDIEKYTDQRFGVADSPPAIQWADLGPSKTGCN